MPGASFLTEGADLAVTSWDILCGHAAPARDVLLFDDNGAHPGASGAEFLARAGARLEFVTPERTVLPEIGGTNYPAYLTAFGEHAVTIMLNRRVRASRAARAAGSSPSCTMSTRRPGPNAWSIRG